MIWYEQYPDITNDILDLSKQGFSFLKHTDNTYSIYQNKTCYLHWGSFDECKEKIKQLKSQFVESSLKNQLSKTTNKKKHNNCER